MLLDPDSIVGECQHVLVADAEALAISLWRGHIACRLAGAAFNIYHLDFLTALRAAQNGTMPLRKRRLKDHEFVRIERPLHDVFPESVGSTDQDDVAEAGLGIEREHNATRRKVGAHHFHDANG